MRIHTIMDELIIYNSFSVKINLLGFYLWENHYIKGITGKGLHELFKVLII